MEYGVLGVGAIGAAIVTGLCEDVDDAPKVLLSPRNAEVAAGLAECAHQAGTCRRASATACSSVSPAPARCSASYRLPRRSRAPEIKLS